MSGESHWPGKHQASIDRLADAGCQQPLQVAEHNVLFDLKKLQSIWAGTDL